MIECPACWSAASRGAMGTGSRTNAVDVDRVGCSTLANRGAAEASHVPHETVQNLITHDEERRPLSSHLVGGNSDSPSLARLSKPFGRSTTGTNSCARARTRGAEVDHVTASEALLNLERARGLMEEANLDALLATTDSNVRYLSNWRSSPTSGFTEYMIVPGGSDELGMPSFAVLRRDGAIGLVIHAELLPNARASSAKCIATYGAQQPANVSHDLSLPPDSTLLEHKACGEALTSVIRHYELDTQRIGVDGSSLRPPGSNPLAATLPRARFLDARVLFRLIRAAKSPPELARLRWSAQINERAGLLALAAAREGVSTECMTNAFRSAAAAAGADFEHFLFGFEGLGIAQDAHYRLIEGSTLFVDFGCVFDGYYSDTGTTLVLGLPTDRALRLFHTLSSAVSAAADASLSGQPASHSHQAGVSAIAGSSLLASDREAATNAFHGHSLGLDVREYPLAAPASRIRLRDDVVNIPSDVRLEPGMVLNFEASVFVPREFSVHVERSFVVSPIGVTPLVSQSREEPFAVPD